MPNDDLISRKALLEVLSKKLMVDVFPNWKDLNFDLKHNIGKLGKAFKREIEATPTVDAEPVRHGRWIETYAYGAWHYDCPFCNEGYATKEREKKPINFCPDCGAKMDLKEDTPCTQQ